MTVESVVAFKKTCLAFRDRREERKYESNKYQRITNVRLTNE